MFLPALHKGRCSNGSSRSHPGEPRGTEGPFIPSLAEATAVGLEDKSLFCQTLAHRLLLQLSPTEPFVNASSTPLNGSLAGCEKARLSLDGAGRIHRAPEGNAGERRRRDGLSNRTWQACLFCHLSREQGAVDPVLRKAAAGGSCLRAALGVILS